MCMFDPYGYDGQSVLLHCREHKAIKTHKCSECGRDIQAGEKYRVERTVFEHQARSYKTCAHCCVVTDWLTKECGGYVYEGVVEDIINHANEGYGFGVYKLAVGARHDWKFKNGKLWPIPVLPPVSEVHH